MHNAILTLRGRVAWTHDFTPDRTVAATFQVLDEIVVSAFPCSVLYTRIPMRMLGPSSN
jgi:hypothetical protein